MFAQLPERQMHWVRWVLTIGWLLIIVSLFYDPWTAALTEPDHPWSPFRLTGVCVQVQGQCVAETPQPLGATLFWGAIVPSGILILLVFGHELWRRICPLSFLSQIPRALGWQRQFKREHQKTGKVRYELAKVKPDSWLGRNYSYVQFSWLFVGLCGRILFFNADRLVLGSWLLFTIACAIAVGYFYGGKSWCQYFCPMAPVQTIFSEPRGLLGSKAHMSNQKITQSMCRTVEPDGSEKSACVACQSPCFDIDSERNYWDELNRPEESLIRYGYVGLVIGYFVYYYLYAGNWDYYFSGVWNRDPNQLAALMNPGLYLFGQVINIPKLFAVPLVLGGFTAIGYGAGQVIEKRAKSHARRHRPNLSSDIIRHQIFAICTFGIFNFFFFFAGRPLLQLTPLWVQFGFDVSIVFLSTLWLQQTWRRNPDLYSRENLAGRFRKQLEKLQLDVAQFLDGRSLDDLHANEVYVLAKVIPGFTREKRHQVYKGVVQEALEEGYVNYSSSLEVLQQMRQELDIPDDEHREVLEELGVEDPELLDPNRQRSLENQVRLNGYQKSLERLMVLQNQQASNAAFNQLVEQNSSQMRSLRQQYSITTAEEEWILSGLSPEVGTARRIEFLLAQLSNLIAAHRAFNQPILRPYQPVLTLLQASIYHKKELIVRSLLEKLVTLQNDEMALKLAHSLRKLSSLVLVELLEAGQVDDPTSLRNRLHPTILSDLTQPGEQATECSLDALPEDVLPYLEALLDDQNPLIQTASLYIIAHLDSERGKAFSRDRGNQANSPLLRETAALLLSLPVPYSSLAAFPMLEKVVYLFNSDFFHRVQSETLVVLADRAAIKTYSTGDVITEVGDTCRELLLLIEGEANIHYQLANQDQLADQVRVERFHPGQILDELEVLAHSKSDNTIIAESAKTRILAISVDAFDDLLNQDSDFARRVLELESRHLQRLVKSGQVMRFR